MYSLIRVISSVSVFFAVFIIPYNVGLSLGYIEATAAIRLSLHASDRNAALMSTKPYSVNRIYVPGDLDQLVTADLDCDGMKELVGVTESKEIYYSDDFITWNPLPGKLGRITADYLNDDCFEDLAGVTESGDVYYTLDLISWHLIPGKLQAASVLAARQNQ